MLRSCSLKWEMVPYSVGWILLCLFVCLFKPVFVLQNWHCRKGAAMICKQFVLVLYHQMYQKWSLHNFDNEENFNLMLCRKVSKLWAPSRFMDASLKKWLVVLHIQPCNKDIYSHMWCSTASLWQTVQCRELELTADVTAGWKQRRSVCIQTIHQKTQ